MADMLHFSLVSPVRELFSGDVKQVDAPGVEGEFGVLPKHAPFMTVLKLLHKLYKTHAHKMWCW